WRMASSNRLSNGSRPKRSDSAAHADTPPGTVTLSQPRLGILAWPAKRSGVHAAGERPDAFRPCNACPSQTKAKASPPMPFMVGSTTVSVMAAASAASIALPPRAKTAAPACAASGCEVATTLRARTGCRPEGKGRFQFMSGISPISFNNQSYSKRQLFRKLQGHVCSLDHRAPLGAVAGGHRSQPACVAVGHDIAFLLQVVEHRGIG